jgi:mono/diheme cytochrome c family protein
MHSTPMMIGAALGVLVLAATVTAQHQHGDAKPPAQGSQTQQHQHGDAKTAAPAAGSRRVTMDELHRGGGVPRGWTFTLPDGGDPAKGRQVFADLECYTCHLVKDAGFPPGGGGGNVGPELTGMGAHHPAEYFAESILSPNAVIVDGPGWIGPDGRSIMPSYADSLSVTQLLDLVAFVRSLGGGHAGHQGDADPAQERTVGPYRLRLVFRPADGHGGHGGQSGHSAHAHHGSKSAAGAGHLMAFVTDATTGEPVPYLPVSAALHAKGAPARVVKLVPMMGRAGFHYGADATLPASTQRIVLTIGPATIKGMGPDARRYAQPQTAAFDWSAPAK